MKMVVFQKNVSLLEVSQLNCENLSWMPIICSPLPMPNRWRLGFLKSWGQTQSSPRVSISFNPQAISTIWGMTKRKKNHEKYLQSWDLQPRGFAVPRGPQVDSCRSKSCATSSAKWSVVWSAQGLRGLKLEGSPPVFGGFPGHGGTPSKWMMVPGYPYKRDTWCGTGKSKICRWLFHWNLQWYGISHCYV